MNISPTINAMNTQFSRMEVNAREVAVNPTKAIPEQIEISGNLKANVSVVKTQDEMYGSLLDIKA